MLRFKTFITESIRQGLPHITTMDHEQFSNLTQDGKIEIEHATEKTDGTTLKIGHDEKGMYTQSSGSGDEKMRKPEHYIERATRRAQETGKPLDLTAAKAFAAAHASLQKNAMLTNHLQALAKKNGGETQVRGELFSKALSRPSDTADGEVKFVGTSYDPSHMGSVGKFVLHSRLPENQGHDVEHFKKNLSSKEINFDDDKITHRPSQVDVSKHLEGMKDIDHELIKSRTTPKNKEAKLKEIAKFDKVKKAVSDEVDKHVKTLGITPKWGTGSEGLVVHPKEGSKAPRFKITSDAFRAYKADPENAKKFKKGK